MVALLVASMTCGVAHFGRGPSHLALSLTADSGFTITSNIYDSPACSGAAAPLDPGVTRCLVFSVHNDLSVPMTVQTIDMSLDSTFPVPPSGCAGADLSLPTFTGALAVPGDGSAATAGLPISLSDTATNQDSCENTALHFSYVGTALYTDTTLTTVASSVNPSTLGAPVTFTATVTATNASSDPALPTGTVEFSTCSTPACAITTPLGTGTVGSNGQASYRTSSLTTGSTRLQATYLGAGTDFSASISPVLTQIIGHPVTSPSSSTTTVTPASGPVTKPSSPKLSGPIAFTGTDLAALVGTALALILVGLGVILVTRRRRTQS
jgi:hypothetical protein